MTGRPWNLSEERLLADKAGLITAKDLGRLLGRSESAIHNHAHRMREEGRLDRDLNLDVDDDYISWLDECAECHEMRSTCDKDGICLVCRRKRQLEDNIARMDRAWRNLPPDYKRRAKRVFDPQRAPKLMSKSANLKPPARPDISEMELFDAMEAMDRWYCDMEAYELSVLRLDIDAVKQRTCKWRKKTRAAEEAKKAKLKKSR